MNPQTSSGAKKSAGSKMSSFQDAARNTAAGYNGGVHNVRCAPSTTPGPDGCEVEDVADSVDPLNSPRRRRAKESAASKGSNMPKW